MLVVFSKPLLQFSVFKLFQFSPSSGCRTKFIELFGGEQKLEEMYLTLASNLYDQALDLYVNNFPKTSDHDNFLETLSFCGAFGLKECFNLKFLESAFTWQSRDGCVIDKTRYAALDIRYILAWYLINSRQCFTIY